MKLYAYREEIISRNDSLRLLERFNTHLPFMLGSQLSCIATPNTQFQIAVDKLVLFQKANCYKDRKLLIEEDAPSTKYVKAHHGRLFKHELKALEDRLYKSGLVFHEEVLQPKAHYSGLECDEKPPTNRLIIKEVDSNVKVVVDPNALALDVYDPQPLKEYVILIEAELLQIRDSLTQVLEKRSYTEEQVVKWHLIGDFFYKKSIYDDHSAHTLFESTQGKLHPGRTTNTKDDPSLSHILCLVKRATCRHSFVNRVMEADIPLGWKPLNLERFDGTTDLDEHPDFFLT
ncbi:hypothetical protein JHK87_001020 [Glycine soja]|nr:hypothetical protein JHK87_001020 [Glycine soja]